MRRKSIEIYIVLWYYVYNGMFVGIIIYGTSVLEYKCVRIFGNILVKISFVGRAKY